MRAYINSSVPRSAKYSTLPTTLRSDFVMVSRAVQTAKKGWRNEGKTWTEVMSILEWKEERFDQAIRRGDIVKDICLTFYIFIIKH